MAKRPEARSAPARVVEIPDSEPPEVSSLRAPRRARLAVIRLQVHGQFPITTLRGMAQRIAVVDDEASIRDVLRELFRARGWDVLDYGSCAEAVAGLAAQPVDLLIVDVNLPDGTGLELVDLLRDGAGRRVPAIVLSGLASETDIARGFAAGAVDFVAKPFRMQELLARCQVQLSRPPAAPLAERTRAISREAHGLPVDEEGLIFGRFEACRSLGMGGQGLVELVRDRERGGQQVALKVMLPSSDPAARTRFIRETYSLSRLSHPGVPAILDVGTCEGWHFYVMEFVPGPTLRRYVEARPLDANELRLLGHGLLQTLEALDAHAIVHRDLKPENVVLRDGRLDQPVIIDFGLARGSTDRAVTAQDIIIGTACYLPPEIIEGTSEYDHRSDLFSAGLTLRFALVGEDVHPDLEGMSLLTAIARLPIPLPPDLPTDLQRLFHTLLAREPGRRAGSAAMARTLLAPGKYADAPTTVVQRLPT